MNDIVYIISIPIIIGAMTLFIPSRVRFVKEALAFITSGAVLFLAARLFLSKPQFFFLRETLLFRVDNLSGFITLFVALFGFLLTIYSFRFLRGQDNLNQYYGCLLMTIGASVGAALANDLVTFITFWGFLGFTLYLLINLGRPAASPRGEPDASYAGKKTLIIVGGTDALMLMGIGIVWHLAGTFSMKDISLPLNSGLAAIAFITLACGAFAKAGAIPFHTWIPACAKAAPLPVMALLPASLDKLVGIYFLARLSTGIFIVEMNSAMSIFLLTIGAVTILAAVMMALIQHDMKKLLAYHAVSQVGYMVLGIGTANPIGIAGGLFHMVNNAIYKTCLFLCGGAVEHKMKTTDLDSLGGLSKAMPITYICCLIAALAISGVPPMNGFVSKWMVYQGIIELGKAGGRLWVLWLVAAIFGSALTLASFMKLIHATFLGRCPADGGPRNEVSPAMWLPMVTLAALCVVFGIFAYQVPIKIFVQPSVSGMIVYPGVWNAGLSTTFILFGILFGIIIFMIGSMKNIRVDEPFIGGEKLREDMKVSGVAFYKTVEEIPFLSRMYGWASKGYFDIYEQGKNLVFSFTAVLRRLHNGVLPTYLAWCLLGAIVLFILLNR